jgi:hypothetical protein
MPKGVCSLFAGYSGTIAHHPLRKSWSSIRIHCS